MHRLRLGVSAECPSAFRRTRVEEARALYSKVQACTVISDTDSYGKSAAAAACTEAAAAAPESISRKRGGVEQDVAAGRKRLVPARASLWQAAS